MITIEANRKGGAFNVPLVKTCTDLRFRVDLVIRMARSLPHERRFEGHYSVRIPREHTIESVMYLPEMESTLLIKWE